MIVVVGVVGVVVGGTVAQNPIRVYRRILILVRAALCRRCLTAVGHYFW